MKIITSGKPGDFNLPLDKRVTAPAVDIKVPDRDSPQKPAEPLEPPKALEPAPVTATPIPPPEKPPVVVAALANPVNHADPDNSADTLNAAEAVKDKSE